MPLPTLLTPRLLAQIDQLSHQHSPLPFPWSGLDEMVLSMPGQTLPIIGYGSLISQASAARTLKSPGAQRTPCIAFACRRVFNYNMPDRVLERYGASLATECRAALNVEVTNQASDMINGILTGLHSSDVDAFRVREHGYDLVPVTCIEWDTTGSQPEARSAFILAAPDHATRAEWQVVRSDILPQPDYLRLCESGAEKISKAYLDFFRKTTFLADKLTPLSTWNPNAV